MESRGRGIPRRDILRYGLGAIGGVIGSALVTPIIGYFTAPAFRRTKEAEWRPLGAVAEFQVGEPVMIEFVERRRDGWETVGTKRSVWVVRKGPADFVVYNPKCTHLGCIVNWHAGHKTFNSPCHGGVFTIDGDVIAGPPPRPLDTLPWRIEEGKLLVAYKEFVVGLTYKKEA